MSDTPKPNNIVAFKKREVTNPDLEKFDKRFEIVKDILKTNISLLKNVDQADTLMMLGPIYFHGNDDPHFKGILNGFMAGVLEGILEDIESDLFKQSIGNSDIPAILNHVETLMDFKLPTCITFPLLRAIYSIPIVLVGEQWLVVDVFVNHQSLRQRAFEVAMEKTDKSVEDLFYPIDDEE